MGPTVSLVSLACIPFFVEHMRDRRCREVHSSASCPVVDEHDVPLRLFALGSVEVGLDLSSELRRCRAVEASHADASYLQPLLELLQRGAELAEHHLSVSLLEVRLDLLLAGIHFRGLLDLGADREYHLPCGSVLDLDTPR